MLPQTTILLLTALAASALPGQRRASSSTNSISRIPTIHKSLPIAPVPRSQARSEKFKEYVRHVRKAKGKKGGDSKGTGENVNLSAPDGANEYALNVTIGNQKFFVTFDTGSSDLWIKGSNLTCVNVNNTIVPTSSCDFGPLAFSTSSSPTFRTLNFTNNFNISYGDGEYASGFAGVDTVTLGNISVPNTEFSVVDEAYWVGDNVTEGLIGFGNPYLTSVFRGSEGGNDTLANQVEYDPWFYNAVKQNLTAPYFSLALNRPTRAIEENPNGTTSTLGQVTIGGIPSNIPLTSTSVTVPNILFNTTVDGKNVSLPAYYTVSAESFNFPGSKKRDTEAPLIILDSGTTLLYLPDEVAEEYVAGIKPSAVYSDDAQAYVVDCNAYTPPLSVTIGGKTFDFDKRDLIFAVQGPPDETCISSVLPGGNSTEDVYILGDRFLVNVLTTFNIATNEITITQRKSY